MLAARQPSHPASRAAVGCLQEQAAPSRVLGVRADVTWGPCRQTASHPRETEQERTCSTFRYLHIGLLRVHQLLDDFPEAICIGEVASQRPQRWVPSPPRPFHAVALRVAETPTQRSDLFRTLRDGETGGITYRTRSIITSFPARTQTALIFAPHFLGNLTG